MVIFRPPAFALAFLSAGLWSLNGPAPVAHGQVLIDESFDGNAVDTSRFTFSGPGDESFFGRTQLNSPGLPGRFDGPPVADGVLRLRLRTFNPFAPGSFFLADEIRTRQSFAPTADASFTFETRARFVDDGANPLAPGLVGGVFLFGLDADFPDRFERDEIDIELLSNRPREVITTNVFNDEGFDTGGDFVTAAVAGLDLTEFNDFRIEWSLESIQFFVNGVLVREATDNLAVEAQDFRLNINAPDSFFTAAFNAAIQPTADPAQNRTFVFEVDGLTITQNPVPEPSTAALLAAAGLCVARRRRRPL